ncbi:hypothetical protein EBZ39_08065 [bacterium]|nr:hypothetical protein [bacterium]
MNFFNSKQARQNNIPVVSDLDAMIAESVPFRFNGKVHHIKPISVIEFYQYTQSLEKLMQLKDAEKVTGDDLVDAYYNLFRTVCETIQHSDIEKMTTAQAGALFALTLDCVTGKAHGSDDEALKKKTTT